MTIRPVARPAFAAPDIVLWGPFDVVRHDQIKPAVFVVVKPSRASGPSALVGDSGFRRNVSESAVPVVVIQNGAAIASHIQIGISIIVEVSDRHALTVVAFAANAGFIGDIGERSVAVIVVERAAQGMRRLINIGGGGLDEEEIHQAILIVVDPAHAGSHGFEVILFFRLRGILLEGDVGALANIGVADRNGCLRFYRGLSGGYLPTENCADREAENW